MFCVHCGNLVQEGGRFCPHCGRITKSHLSSKRKLILTVFFFFIFGTAGWLTYDHYRSHLPKIAFAQLDAIRNGEITRAYYEYSSEEFKKKTPLLTFKEFIKNRPVFYQNKTLHVKDSIVKENKGILSAELMANNDEKQQVSYQFVKDKGVWKIAKIRCKDANILIDEEDEKDMKRLIEGQLSALNKHDIPDAYYHYTSKEFQRFTSLSSFQEFADFFKVMQNFKSLQFRDLTFEEGLTQWEMTLQENQSETQVTYIFCKEEGLWKILGIQFNEYSNDLGKNPAEIVHAQLQAIGSHEVAKAYFEFTSKEFRKKTSLKDFKNFLKMQESFYLNRDAQLNQTHEEKNAATILAIIKSMESEVLSVEYELVLEDDLWKIDQIQLKA